MKRALTARQRKSRAKYIVLRVLFCLLTEVNSCDELNPTLPQGRTADREARPSPAGFLGDAREATDPARQGEGVFRGKLIFLKGIKRRLAWSNGEMKKVRVIDLDGREAIGTVGEGLLVE